MAWKRKIFIFFLLFLFANVTYAGHIHGKATGQGMKDQSNIVIYIDKIDGKQFSPPDDLAIIDQKQIEYFPNILPIVKGTTVGFKNSDSVLHNVFAVGDEEFDLGTWKGEEIRPYTFNNPGEVIILCNLHPSMEATILVLDTPYFALSDKDGSFEIGEVPAGKYVLKAWHMAMKVATKRLTVPASGDAVVNFTLRN